MFENNKKKKKIDKLTQEILDLTVERKELELSRDTIKQEIQLEKEKRDHEVKLEQTSFDADKANWKKDMAALENRLKTESDTKLTEAVSLGKLDKEQDIAKLKNGYENKINDLRTKHSEEISNIKADLSQKHYDKLQEVMVKFNTEGTITTKFMQEIATGLLDKMPASKMEARLISDGRERSSSKKG